MTVLDPFAGAGGWSEALRMFSIPDVIGIELDPWACATAEAAGHKRIQADVSMVDLRDFSGVTGLVGSPPCPSFSPAGKGLGKLDMARILAHIARIRTAGRWLHYSREGWHDPRSALVLEPLRYALTLRPDWIALEQVPPVLPIWEAIADVLRDHGYHVECGLLTAEQFGVAQTRKRAILAARRCEWHQDGASPQRLRELACPIGTLLPAPTHRKYRKGVDRADGDQSLQPWVSMADALGWGLDDRPAWTVTGGGTGSGGGVEVFSNAAARARLAEVVMRSNYGTSGDPANRGTRTLDEPAPTVTGKVNRNKWVRISGQACNSGPRAQRDPRTLDDPSYTIRALGSGSHPSGVEWVMRSSAMANATVRPLSDPAPTITASHDRAERVWVPAVRFGNQPHSAIRSADEPAATLRFSERMNACDWIGPKPRRVSVQEAAVLQSFTPNYPWQGPPTKQYLAVGNAIPPLLAHAVLRGLIDPHLPDLGKQATP